MLKWSEHAGGGALAEVSFVKRIAERAEQRRRTDDTGSGSIYGVVRLMQMTKSRAKYASRKGVVSGVSCDCDVTDIDMTYYMCCLTVRDSPSYNSWNTTLISSELLRALHISCWQKR
jgi:hypothetical protein